MTRTFYRNRREEVGAAAWAWWVLLLGTIVVILIGAIFFGIRWATAPAKGKLEAREQINSGATRIAAYNHFFDVCASVQSLEASLLAQEEALAGSKGEDRERIKANIAGIKAARADAVNQYNQDARKDYTIGQFKSSKLPYQLPTTFERGETTSCAA